MKTSALPPGRRLNGRNPAHASAPASESARIVWLGWIVTASIAKNANAIPASVAASPSMLSSRLNAFVIPTSQRSASAQATTCVDQLHVGAGREHEDCGRDLQRELRERRHRAQVVDEARDEEDRDAAVDAGDLAGQRHGPDGDREPEARR